MRKSKWKQKKAKEERQSFTLALIGLVINVCRQAKRMSIWGRQGLAVGKVFLQVPSFLPVVQNKIFLLSTLDQLQLQRFVAEKNKWVDRSLKLIQLDIWSSYMTLNDFVLFIISLHYFAVYLIYSVASKGSHENHECSREGCKATRKSQRVRMEYYWIMTLCILSANSSTQALKTKPCKGNRHRKVNWCSIISLLPHFTTLGQENA